MAIRPLPDPALLRKLLRYEPDTGKLFWLPRPVEMFNEGQWGREHVARVWNTKNAGNEAFNRPHGSEKLHLSGTFMGSMILAHRVAWAIHYGVSEFGIVDHLNGNGHDNRITNLRLANREMNSQNCRQRHDCTSGVTGVHWHVSKRWGRPMWVARIQVGKRRIRLGSFDRLEDAAKARREAEIKFGFGPVHGKGGK